MLGPEGFMSFFHKSEEPEEELTEETGEGEEGTNAIKDDEILAAAKEDESVMSKDEDDDDWHGFKRAA